MSVVEWSVSSNGLLVKLGTRVALLHVSVCISSLHLLHSPILSNCKVTGAFKSPMVEIYTPAPETPQAFHHLFLIPEITPPCRNMGSECLSF